MTGLSRRMVIGGALAGLASAASAQELVSRFRSVWVDVAPLVAIGGRGPAQVIAQVLPAKLSADFASFLAPANARAPTLVARIDQIYLSSFADVPSSGTDSFGSMDSLEGAGLVISGRQVLSTTPLRVTLPASYSGAYYLPDIDVRRITSLCDSFASWLRREMNL